VNWGRSEGEERLNDRATLPRWAPRISRDKIRRFYEASAEGVLSDELIDDVGTALHRRCQDIVTVTEGHMGGSLPCPSCGEMIRRRGGKDEVLNCRKCSWSLPWQDYFGAYHKKQLFGGNAIEVFEGFVTRWPEAKTRTDKVLLVDELIHQCHYDARLGPTRPVAVNLIEGKLSQVRAFLDELAEGPLADTN
jgi:ribosomal protein L37AE/L43A